MKTQISSTDWEILSAYLDGQLSLREQTRLTQRLEAQPELKRALEDLRQTRIILRSAPHRRAPRSFKLTPQMVPQRRKSWFALVPSLGLTSAFSTLMLIFSLALRLLPGFSVAQPMASAPAAALFATSPASSRAMDSQSQATGVPLIVWGPASGMGGGAGGGSGEAPGIGGGPQTETLEPQPQSPPQVALEPQKMAQTPAPDVAGTAPPIQGAGPILGIRPPEEQGKISITESGSPQSPQLPQDSLQAPSSANALPDLLGVQVLLGLLALTTGAAALYLRRRS
jgi:hypothetical protein